jgi:hypothetical protein
MARDVNQIKAVRKDLELARSYRSRGDVAVATLLYNKAISRVMRMMYYKKTGRHAPREASLSYLSSKAAIPDEVGEYIRSVMEVETEEEQLGSFQLQETSADGGGKLLYMDGLIKRLLDYSNAYD